MSTVYTSVSIYRFILASVFDMSAHEFFQIFTEYVKKNTNDK